jgi:hypothetical protein
MEVRMQNVKLFIMLGLSVAVFNFVNCGGKKKAEEESMMENELAEETTTNPEAPAPVAEMAQPSPKKPEASAAFDRDGRYTIQISVFASQKAAERLSKKLQDNGWQAYVADVQDPKPDLSGTYYRVRIGYFSGLSGAREFCDQNLATEGYTFWIDNKENDHIAKSGEMPEAGSGSYTDPASTPATTAPTWGPGTSTPDASTPSTSSGTTDSWGSGSSTGTPASSNPSTSTGTTDSWGSGSTTTTPDASTPASGTGTTTTTPAADDWGTGGSTAPK